MINTLNWELQTTDIHALPVLGAGRPMSGVLGAPGEGPLLWAVGELLLFLGL